MKKIRIHFPRIRVDFIVDILKERYELVFDQENPEFIFAEKGYNQYDNKENVKIFFTTENLISNFNLCDYGFGFHYINFDDRYIRCPIYFVAGWPCIVGHWKKISKANLKEKKKFCNFIYSNGAIETAPERTEFFHLLSQYKKVDSAGAYLCNTEKLYNNDPTKIRDFFDILGHYKKIRFSKENSPNLHTANTHKVEASDRPSKTAIKIEFIKQFKFTIAFENGNYNGYTTEKIIDAFIARTVPIYWGNPRVAEDFVPGSFINANDFDSLEALVEEVKRIDNDDEAYMKMLNTHPIPEKYWRSDYWESKLRNFLFSILDQDVAIAKCRPFYYRSHHFYKKTDGPAGEYKKQNKFRLFIKKLALLLGRD